MALARMEWLQSNVTPERIAKVKQLESIAQQIGCTTSQLALAWVAKNPRVTSVITGATKLSQLEENLGALEVLDGLDDETMVRIQAIF